MWRKWPRRGPTSSQSHPMEAVPRESIELGAHGNKMEAEEEGADSVASTGTLGGCCPSSPAVIPVPASPSLPVQVC